MQDAPASMPRGQVAGRRTQDAGATGATGTSGAGIQNPGSAAATAGTGAQGVWALPWECQIDKVQWTTFGEMTADQ